MVENEKSCDEFQTISEMLEINSKRYAIRKAFLLRGENEEITHISYRRFYSHTQRLAHALTDMLGSGEIKVGICMKNCYEWCVSYFGICNTNGIAVPLERELNLDDLLNIIDFAGIDAIITEEKTAHTLFEIRSKLPKNFKIISIGDNNENGIVSFSSLLEKGKTLEKGENILPKSKDPLAPAVFLFTSGTTGMAKAVMLSNKNICSDITGVTGIVDVNYNDSTLCVLPLHHTYQTIIMLIMLCIGGSVSFCENLRHAAQDMMFFKPTVLACVPLLLEKTHGKIIKKLGEQSHFKKSITVGKAAGVLSKISGDEMKKHIFSLIHEAFGGNLRLIITGAAAIDEDVVRDYEAFGFPVIIGYGLTECSPIAICNSLEQRKPDSIGKPINGAEAKIANPGADGIGEICIKGPMVMLGYYKNEQATQEAIIDGWFHTGDLGYCDDEMNFHITGRLKNIIIAKNGKNVYPEELEYYLNKDPMVLESLIFSDNDIDEQVTAAVVPDEEAIKNKLQKEKLTKEDIQNAILQVVRRINRALPSYKSIRKVKIHEDELEKTSTNKVRRNSRKNREKSNEIDNIADEDGKSD